MPEYLAPGVYVEEIAGGVTPIPGVATSTGALAGRELIERMAHAVRDGLPGWTDHNAHDPGITVLEVLACVAYDLQRYATTPQARASATRIAGAFAHFANDRLAEAPLRRPRYFTGKVLSASDFSLEQDYLRETYRRHNRALLGAGVVAGLAVHVEGVAADGAPSVVVSPGTAIAPDGALLAIGCAVRFAVLPPGDAAFVTVRYGERAAATVPTGDPSGTEVSEVEEIAVLALAVAPAPHEVALARLVHAQGAWQLDPAFIAPRARLLVQA
jgi:hypothetical protein